MQITDKNTLRKSYKKIRKDMTLFQRRIYDMQIFENVIKLDAFKNSNKVLVYISSEIEVDTFAIICYALKMGKKVFAPKCVSDSNDMFFYEIKSFDDLEQGSFKIFEPKEYCQMIVDFNDTCCIVPALAYDKRGYRLGFGKGFYDKFLCKFSGEKIGICYDNCVCSKLPNDEFDVSVDWLVTENRIVNLNDFVISTNF